MKRRENRTRRSGTREVAEMEEFLKSEIAATQSYWHAIEAATKGRHLHGIEWAIAADAWKKCIRTEKRLWQFRADKKLRQEEIELPTEPKPATIPKITPFELAQVSALLAGRKEGNTTTDFLPVARELLIQAATYLESCNAAARLDSFQYGGVTFDDILASNSKHNTTGLKLLPGITGGMKSTKGERFKGLERCIREFYKQQEPENLTGESFIKEKFLPSRVLIQIRAWRFRHKRDQALNQRKGGRK